MKPETLRSRLLSLLCAMTLFITASDSANAQDTERSRQVGVAAQGSDMWNQAMSGLGLFTPHRDDCSTETEVFVKVYAENSVDFGFCIEKEERVAEQWEDAKHTCLSQKKRLPEPAEFKYACDSASGLNNMTDDREWASNFAKFEFYENGHTSYRVLVAPGAGEGACHRVMFGSVFHSVGGATSYPFRCVR